MNQPKILLNNQTEIPQFGLGVYLIEGDAATKQACIDALELGYRHIDTAHGYMNERGVGQAIKKTTIPRNEIWVTSKLLPAEYGEGVTQLAIEKMLKRLNLEYIDLLLLHHQFGDTVGAWKDMEKAVAAGSVKSIGLSNFDEDHFNEILSVATITPSVMQVECHPYYQQKKLKNRLAEHNIALESYYPLGHADKNLLQEPVIVELAKKYTKSPAQIILRWHIQSENIVFPKTTNLQHMKENIDIFDFNLNKDEMFKINSLDKNTSLVEGDSEDLEKLLLTFLPPND